MLTPLPHRARRLSWQRGLSAASLVAVAGRWVASWPGYRWEPHAWVHAGNGWHLREGHWVRR